MSALVEIYPGTWVHPEEVTAVVARNGRAEIYAGAGPVPPAVHVRVAAHRDDVARWEFNTWDEAKAFAAKIAEAVNAAALALLPF